MDEWFKHIPYWIVIVVLGILVFGPKQDKTIIKPGGQSSPINVNAYGGCQTLEALYGRNDKK